jgi:hypothetical protein
MFKEMPEKNETSASNSFSRRKFITASAVSLGAVTINSVAAQAVSLAIKSPASNTVAGEFKAVYNEYAGHMQKLVDLAKVKVDGYSLMRPCSSKHYNGLWHDDFTWPMIGYPELQKGPELCDSIKWITRASIDLPVVPDRIEYDGTPIMNPGAGDSRPMSESMPLHLPSAWVRLLSYAEKAGCTIPQKQAWAQLIKRSFQQVPFAFDLVYSDPQRSIIGFGFMDSIRLTGLDLMTSLVTIRGMERSASLFKGFIDDETIAQWSARAAKIRKAIPRLFDEEIGGFLGATRKGRAFSVWGNGLAWSLADADQKKIIARTFTDKWSKIFLQGCTRQVPGPKGWPGTNRPVTYMNGGYWGTGTGFVLPAIAAFDSQKALGLAKELLANFEKFKYAEYLQQDGAPAGPLEFLGTVSMPMMGLRAVIENKPLLDYM